MRSALRILDHVPDSLLRADARDLNDLLSGPTLIDLPGRAEAPLFVSVLLHGNEDTGLRAAQEVLRRHRDRLLPRPLLLFIGNVEAAAAGVRTLDGQVDFNRVWPGTVHGDTAETRLMREVVDYATARRPFASIDIHNNTGRNPHYACINRLDGAFLHLARLFSRTIVHFDEPAGVQSAAMAALCPAVTVECGHAGEQASTEHAAEFFEACLALSEFPSHPPPREDVDLLRTFAVVKVPSGTTFSFDGTDADIRFRDDVDSLNFSEVEAGTLLGTLGPDAGARLEVRTRDDAPSGALFSYADGEVRLAVPAIPSMLTRDVQAVRLDCLGYLMHRIPYPE